MSRQIFPDLRLFKKTVTERFLSVLYHIYENHPTYTYYEEEDESKIFIYPSYANHDRDGAYPRFIVKAGGYNYGLMDTLNNNMSKEIYNSGVLVGQEHQQFVNTTVTILVQANAEEESSDLADELVSIAVYASRQYFRSQGLLIRNASVSETDLFNKEQDVFQTNINFTLDVPWTTSTVDTGSPIEVSPPELEIDDPLIFDTYRSPGVAVVKQKTD